MSGVPVLAQEVMWTGLGGRGPRDAGLTAPLTTHLDRSETQKAPNLQLWIPEW